MLTEAHQDHLYDRNHLLATTIHPKQLAFLRPLSALERLTIHSLSTRTSFEWRKAVSELRLSWASEKIQMILWATKEDRILGRHWVCMVAYIRDMTIISILSMSMGRLSLPIMRPIWVRAATDSQAVTNHSEKRVQSGRVQLEEVLMLQLITKLQPKREECLHLIKEPQSLHR